MFFLGSLSSRDYSFLFICSCNITFSLGASTQYQLLRLARERTLKDLIKTTSGHNGANRFVTLLFDEMKIKENLILVEHRELHWFYWFRRRCHKYLELWQERRFRYTCIGVFCQRCFFKFKLQFIDFLWK